MIKNNRLCQILGIKYPILQAAMAWICGPELVAAVSNAGGLGCIAINSGLKKPISEPSEAAEFLRSQIRDTRKLTDKPFTANLLIGRDRFRVFSDAALEVAIQEKIPAALLTYLPEDDPENYTAKLRAAGIKVIHRPIECNAKGCKKAEDTGADAVVITGFEAGGHSGSDELTTFVLVPIAANAVKIPVVAGGGIVNGRGMLAAFALGAEGVYIGTRFICSTESLAHPNYKRAVLDAVETSTVTYDSPNGLARAMKNRLSDEVLTMVKKGATLKEIEKVAYRGTVRKGLIDGDMVTGWVSYGTAALLVEDIVSSKAIIERLLTEYRTALRQLYKNSE